jgi:hypothetical protein
MDSPKTQLADKLKTANNVLVTVSRNPSVDQLAACIGLTLLLNKQGKHAAAVFSGAIPSTMEFLQPENTLEKNTDSLRDFIIALDKSKADKLRYKVEDNVVRIFITPYKTSISQDDLEFSQGDFNVDVVVALGVMEQADLDEAITAHGRILHDATVATINVSTEGSLGVINWNDPAASSLSELVTDLTTLLGKDLLDGQIATALLTGIVAETNRFSNEKTTPQTMSASAALMAAGANQQLVASKLDVSAPDTPQPLQQDTPSQDAPDGTLAIEHGSTPTPDESPAQPATEDNHEPAAPEFELPEPVESEEPDVPEVPEASSEVDESVQGSITGGSRMITEAPTMGGMLTANSVPEGFDATSDPLSQATQTGQLLEHDKSTNNEPLPSLDELLGRTSPNSPNDEVSAPSQSAARKVVEPIPELPEPIVSPPPTVEGPVVLQPDSSIEPTANLSPAPVGWQPPNATVPSPPAPAQLEGPQTLSEIESLVRGQQQEAADTHLVNARDQVMEALNSNPNAPAPEPIQALNAQPLGEQLHPTDLSSASEQPPAGYTPAQSVIHPDNMPAEPEAPAPPSAPTPQVFDPNAPPPVPPPIPFQFGSGQ